MIDMHSHILPAIDDGSRDPEMTLEMLEESYRQGITDIVATPHFYINKDNIESFLEKRNNAYDIIKGKISDRNDVPNIYLGAEVYFFNGISRYDGLDKLCINNSKYMLLEMPFNKWSSKVLTEVENIIFDRKIIPIIAHIERYLDLQHGTDNINNLFSLEVIIQANASYVNYMFSRKKALKWIDNNIIQLMGSDAHNMDSRAPNLGKAYDIIKKKLGDSAVNRINSLGKEILSI